MTSATLSEWALKNGIDANIKSMSQAEKTMLRYQYVMANVSGVLGDYQKTNLTFSNQIRMLGQNFQRLGSIIGSGFIAWLRPMVVSVNNAMDSIIASVQRVVNALGKIFGWQMIVDTTGEQLIEDTEGVADAWDDATDSAKKFAKQLLGIDELNNLTTQDKSGSGDDSGLGGGLSGGNIIQPGGIRFEKFESDIDNLYDLGKKISDKLKDMLSGIDWQSIYGKAENFGKGLADFLNGSIQPDTFYQTGRTIAGALNTAISFAFGFGKNFDWENLGESIGQRINGFFDEFDFKKLAETLNVWAEGIWEAIKKAVATIDWKDVFESLFTFASNLDIETVNIAIGAFMFTKGGRILTKAMFSKALAKVFGLEKATTASGLTAGAFAFQLVAALAITFDLSYTFAKKWTESDAFKETADAIGAEAATAMTAQQAGGNLDFQTMKILRKAWKNAKGRADESLGERPIAYTSQQAMGNLDMQIIQALMGTKDSAKSGQIKKETKEVGENIADGINEGMVEEVKSTKDSTSMSVFELIKKSLEISFGIHSPAKKMYPIGENIILGIFGGFSLVDFSEKMNEWWNEEVKPWFSEERWEGLTEGLTTAWNNAIKAVKELWNKFATWLNEKLKLSWDGFSIGGKEIIPSGSFDLGKIPTFANGGYPNQGSLFLAGETYGQSEWIGNVNGRTGVVSGSEITGIANAIYQTSSEELVMLRQQNQLLQGILEKEFGISTDDVGKAARSYGRDYYNRTGNNAFVY